MPDFDHKARERPRVSRARAFGWLAPVATLAVALAVARAHDHPAAATPLDPPRRLIFALDGFSYEALQNAQAHGLFTRFRYAGRHVSTYPSMSHPAWTEIIGTRRLFGARGNIRTIEARWFDLDAQRIAGDPRQVIARQAGPYNYQRAFDYYFDPLEEPLMYLPGRKLFDRELDEAEQDILEHFTGDHYVAFIGGTDALAHTHLNALQPYLARLDSMINRVADSLDHRGTPAELWIVSDHGNAGAFREGQPESYLATMTLGHAIARAGLVRADTGRLEQPNQVAVVTIALGTMVNVYFADLSRRRVFANAALGERGVNLVTWLEVEAHDRYVVVLGEQGSEAHLRWRNGAYAYQRVHGNPLELPAALGYDGSAPRWISDADMRSASDTSAWPDAPFRLVQGARKQVENEPDLIVNLRDGYCYAGDLGRFVRMVRTHGSLGARSSLGVLASTEHPVPAYVRGEEIAGIIGLSPAVLMASVHDLHPHDAAALADTLLHQTRMVPSGRDVHSTDAMYLRRERPIVLSLDYFAAEPMRALLAAAQPDSAAARRNRQREQEVRDAIRNAHVVRGVSANVDTLLPLADSLGDPTASRARLDAFAARFREIPDLASLASLRDQMGAGAHSRGGAESARRTTMAMWTLPYFLDAALLAPESDSIPDPRDRDFARAWTSAVQAKVIRNPAMLLDDSTLAPRLFHEVFSERELLRSVEPATVPLVYDPPLGDITIVYIPGIYDELFDGEIWSRGLHAVHDRLGLRVVTMPVDGRCGSGINAAQIVSALHDDTRRRLERGYDVPRYLLVGYSKGGVDATEALLQDTVLARTQVAALVTIATPHRGTPVAERANIPGALEQMAVSKPMPAACDSAGASESLWPATRAAFWSEHEASVATLTRFFSLSLVSDAGHAHPWMKLTKQIGQFPEPNDGVVALSSSHFPAGLHATSFGTADGDHIAGRLASSFPQESFMEALVITVAELGALDPSARGTWARVLADRLRQDARRGSAAADARVAELSPPRRVPVPPPGGATGWRGDKTFRMSHLFELADVSVATLSPAQLPEGIVFRCDQGDILAFRREYEFYYDAGNGGSENGVHNGFSIVPADGTADGRACHMATQATSIKMTTVAFRFRAPSFPLVRMRLRVERGPTLVDASRAARGKNDAAFKLWIVTRDTRPGQHKRIRLLGYWWPDANVDGAVPNDGTFVEATSSRRNVLLTTLPEAWLVTVGGPSQEGQWVDIARNLADDLRHAYPDVPASALEIVGVTLQSDSDDSRTSSDVYLDGFAFRPQTVAASAR